MRIGVANGWLIGASGLPFVEMSIGLGVVGRVVLGAREGALCRRRLVAGRLTGVVSCLFLGGRFGVVRSGLSLVAILLACVGAGGVR